MKSNILLVAINAKYIHSNLAVYSLREYARRSGMEADIAEFTINRKTEDILREIYEKHPSVLCFSCYIWNIEYVREILAEYHRLCPKTPIWLGGPEVSYNAEEFLRRNPAVTGIMTGEGEETFLKLCLYYEGKAELGEVPGICAASVYFANEDSEEAFKHGGIESEGQEGYIIRHPEPALLSMDELPFCYSDIENFENRIIYYESSRGCPFSCSYCLSSINRSVRFRSLPIVKKELKFFLDKRVPQVKFVDRTFNCNHEHAYEIWQYIFKNDNGITNFHFEISADLLNEDEIDLLLRMRPGLVQLEIGLQSVNSETIKEISRSMDIPKLKEAVRRIGGGHNIHLHLDLIAGLPHENIISFKNSFDEAYAMKPQQLQLGFLKVLKGSSMYRAAKKYGILYRKKPPYEVMETRWLSYEDIGKLKLVEKMLDIYYNSGQFLRTAAILEEVFQSAFLMYLKLGEFYKGRGLLDKSLTRLARGEVLLEFAGLHDRERISLYKESLIFDLYLTENIKKRPEWAKDLSRFKKETNMALKDMGYDKKYCHAEPFYYPLYEMDIISSESSVQLKSDENITWVLFDYERRNPLSNEAAVSCVKIERGM